MYSITYWRQYLRNFRHIVPNTIISLRKVKSNQIIWQLRVAFS